MKKNCIQFAALLLLSACSTPKLSDLAEKTDLSSKAKFDYNLMSIRDNGKGFSLDTKKYPTTPKRIALITFYSDDPGLTKRSSIGGTTTWNTTNTGSHNAKLYANLFYNSSISALKSTFNASGMELLSAEEAIAGDNAKREAYNSFVVRHTTLNKIGNGLKSFMKNMGSNGTTIEVDEAADGFKLLKVNNREIADDKKKTVGPANLAGCFDGQMLESLGADLCAALGVDAVLVVYNSHVCDTRWSKDRFWLGAVNMYMFGPNPLPLKEGKKDNNSYNKGIFYSGVRMKFNHGLLLNPKIKKDMTEESAKSAMLKGYNNAILGCATKIIAHVTKGKR